LTKNPWAAGKLHIWCKGVTMNAAVNVTAFASAANCTYEVGFVQILEFSRMKAIYADKVVKEWIQPTLPCYDSTNNACIPWYTPHTDTNPDPDSREYSHAKITGAQTFNLKLRDYPTSFVDPHINHPIPNKSGPADNGPHPLTYYTKHNEFNAYLMVRKKDGNGKESDTYL
jgi:hypothetical protein